MPTNNNLAERIAEMKAAAEAIICRVWTANVMPYRATVSDRDAIVAEIIEGEGGKERQRNIANFMSQCDPQNVLALIARVEQLEREVAGLRQANQMLNGIAHGLGDVINGRTTPLEEVRKRLGIKAGLKKLRAAQETSRV
jgi:hypothetical protein